jgi:tetratricopeptide (TPR) repeat protein
VPAKAKQQMIAQRYRVGALGVGTGKGGLGKGKGESKGKGKGKSKGRDAEKAKQEAADKAKQEAAEKARKEAAATAAAEAAEKAKQEAAEKAKQEAADKAKQCRSVYEQKYILQQEAAEKAKQEAAEKAKQEAADMAKQEAAEKAKQEAAEKAKQEAAAKAKQEAAEKAKQEAAEKATYEDDRKGDLCAMCLESLSTCTIEQKCTLPCGHTYHCACVQELRKYGINDSCPMCRAPLPPGTEELYERASRILHMADRMLDALPYTYTMRDLKKKRAEEAEKLLRKALEEDPQHARCHGNLAHCLEIAGDIDAAISSNKVAIGIDPNLAFVHFNLGVCLRLNGDLEGAAASWTRAIEVDPKFAGAHHNLGCFFQDRDTVRAIASIEAAIAVDPYDQNRFESYFVLGNMLADIGDTHGAVLNLSIAAGPTTRKTNYLSAKAHHCLAVLQQEMGVFDAAIKLYKEASKLNPEDGESQCNLGGILLDVKNDADGAIVAFEMAAKCDKSLANAHLNLGHALKAKKRLDEAIDAYKAATVVDPQYAMAHFCLAEEYRKQGQYRAAFDEYKFVYAPPTLPPDARYENLRSGRCYEHLPPPFVSRQKVHAAMKECEVLMQSNPELCANAGGVVDCRFCQKPDAKLRCGRCKSVKYCSRDCQQDDWKIHKSACAKQKSKNQSSRADSGGERNGTDSDVSFGELTGSIFSKEMENGLDALYISQPADVEQRQARLVTTYGEEFVAELLPADQWYSRAMLFYTEDNLLDAFRAVMVASQIDGTHGKVLPHLAFKYAEQQEVQNLVTVLMARVNEGFGAEILLSTMAEINKVVGLDTGTHKWSKSDFQPRFGGGVLNFCDQPEFEALKEAPSSEGYANIFFPASAILSAEEPQSAPNICRGLAALNPKDLPLLVIIEDTTETQSILIEVHEIWQVRPANLAWASETNRVAEVCFLKNSREDMMQKGSLNRHAAQGMLSCNQARKIIKAVTTNAGLRWLQQELKSNNHKLSHSFHVRRRTSWGQRAFDCGGTK